MYSEGSSPIPSRTENIAPSASGSIRSRRFEREIQETLGKLGCVRLRVWLSGIRASSLPSPWTLTDLAKRLHKHGVVGALPSGNIGLFYFGPADGAVSAEEKFSDMIARSLSEADHGSGPEPGRSRIDVVSVYKRLDEITDPCDLIQAVEQKLAQRSSKPGDRGATFESPI